LLVSHGYLRTGFLLLVACAAEKISKHKPRFQFAGRLDLGFFRSLLEFDIEERRKEASLTNVGAEVAVDLEPPERHRFRLPAHDRVD
jgi:hypothetical protein